MKLPFLFACILLPVLTISAQNVKKDMFDQASVKMSEIKINTAKSDFGPTVIDSFIFFTSYRDELITLPDNELIKNEFYDLFDARIDDSGDVIGSRHALEEFITRFHDGPVSWCPKTKELFITQSNYVDPDVVYKPFKNEDVKLRIVIAQKLKGQWTIVDEFPYNNPKFSIGHPAINESGDTLYFASDMPGGYGETDLYYSIRKKNKWNTPVNLGSTVNTKGKDQFPFITGNSYSGRYLIFASTGHGSMGGFDLFYQNLNKQQSEVTQFQEPINSLFDDFGMNLPENVEFGYMTSNRPGTGNDDIYKLTLDKYIDFLLEIFVLDSKSWKPIKGADLKQIVMKYIEIEKK